jgi:hypothetical protein
MPPTAPLGRSRQVKRACLSDTVERSEPDLAGPPKWALIPPKADIDIHIKGQMDYPNVHIRPAGHGRIIMFGGRSTATLLFCWASVK